MYEGSQLMNIIEEAKQRAVIVLEQCARPVGFYASGLPGGYEAVWTRDSMISSLGASLVWDRFKTAFRKSILLLTKHQSPLGQIPNAVGDYNKDRGSRVTYNSIDSSLWYLIGHKVYAKSYRDNTLLTHYKKNIEKTFRWLRYQDPNEDTLLVQQPTMDWQDAFPHKYGRVINTQALYYAALTMHGERRLAQRLKKIVNGERRAYLSLYDKQRGYYLPWIWKNHDGEREEEHWFDTLGNLLAILSGLATPLIAKRILSYVEKKRIARPYPAKAIYPPIRPKDKEWHSYFSKAESRTPYHYLNAGIWPFIGGFYVAALVKVKQFAKAKKELEFLARANKLGINREWGFQEWLDGESGAPRGTSHQGWSAGAFIFAYTSLKQKRVPFF